MKILKLLPLHKWGWGASGIRVPQDIYFENIVYVTFFKYWLHLLLFSDSCVFPQNIAIFWFFKQINFCRFQRHLSAKMILIIGQIWVIFLGNPNLKKKMEEIFCLLFPGRWGRRLSLVSWMSAAETRSFITIFYPICSFRHICSDRLKCPHLYTGIFARRTHTNLAPGIDLRSRYGRRARSPVN